MATTTLTASQLQNQIIAAKNAGTLNTAMLNSLLQTGKDAGITLPQANINSWTTSAAALDKTQAAAALTKLQQQYTNQITAELNANTLTTDKLNSIVQAAKDAGVTINPATYAQKAAAIDQLPANAALAQQKQQFQNQLTSELNANTLTTDKLNSIVQAAKTAGVTIDPTAYAQKATAIDQQIAQAAVVKQQQADAAAKQQAEFSTWVKGQGTPTSITNTFGPGGQEIVGIPADPIAGTPAAWYQVSGTGVVKLDENGLASGPVIPSADINKLKGTVQQNLTTYQTQQAQQQKIAEDLARQQALAAQQAAQQAAAAQQRQTEFSTVQQAGNDAFKNLTIDSKVNLSDLDPAVVNIEKADLNRITQNGTVPMQMSDPSAAGYVSPSQLARYFKSSDVYSAQRQTAYSEAAKLPTPTSFTNKYTSTGQELTGVPDDPTTPDDESGWYTQTPTGIQKIGSDGKPTGPVIPNFDEFGNFKQTIQTNTTAYEQQQQADQKALAASTLAKNVTDFESAMPTPAEAAAAGKNILRGPDGSHYFISAADPVTGTPQQWVKEMGTSSTISYKNMTTGEDFGNMTEFNKYANTIDEHQAQVAMQQRQQLIADQTKAKEGMGLEDFGKILAVMAIGSLLINSGIFSAFGEAASATDIGAAAEGLASEGMSAADIATELSNTFGIDSAAAETAANVATEISTGAMDAASFLPETLTPEMLADAAATSDPLAALNASAGWGASDVGYLQSIGATPDLIATAGANNIALGYDAYGMNILNAAETADIMSGVNPAFTNFLTEEATGSAASEALGHGLTMGSSGLGMTAGTVPGLATMGGAGGLTIPAAGGGILSELGVFFPGALALAAIGGTLGAGAAAAGLPAGSVVEPPLSPLTPGEPVVSQPVTPVEATPPAPPVETPPAPVEAVGPPAPVEPPPAPPASELGGFKPGTAPGSPGLGMTAGTGVAPVAEMGGASGLTIPAAGGGTLSAGGVTAAGAGGAALLGNLGQGAAAAGVPAGAITEPIAPGPQPNLTDMGGGKGLNPSAAGETGVTGGTGAANVPEMGGAQGLTVPAAGGGTLTQAGVAAGAGAGLTGSLGTASDAVATSLPSNTSVPTTSGAVSPGPEVVDRAPDWTNPNPTPDKSVLQQVKDLTGASNLDLLSAGAAAIGAAAAPTPKKWAGWAPIDPLTLKHLAPLEQPGTNPGYFVGATPFYNTRSPVQSEFYWGQHPYQTGAGFNQGQYNNIPNAPVAPWGLQEMYTPTDIPTYLASLKTNAARSLAAPVKATKV